MSEALPVVNELSDSPSSNVGWLEEILGDGIKNGGGGKRNGFFGGESDDERLVGMGNPNSGLSTENLLNWSILTSSITINFLDTEWKDTKSKIKFWNVKT